MNELTYLPVIGLEIHVELKTVSKMFCGCKNDPFHAPKPNVYTCPVCLGLPGALPVPNRKAVEWCVKLGLALNCEIPLFSKFDRKNYFYPDLSKGYQISQYDQPFAVNGQLKFKSQISNLKTEEEKKIRIRRVHLEEDTGKLLHATVNGKKVSLIDFNRSGVPLVEIVTEPDIRSSEEARLFLKKLHQIIRYLGISDADMEKGSMRLEPNISVKQMLSLRASAKQSHSIDQGIASSPSAPRNDSDTELPPYKVEVKNINSFNFAKKAIDYEISRHIELLKQGEIPKQETRGWDEKKGVTVSQRSKEEAQDYRYFPEPDIPPVRWSQSQISRPTSHGRNPGGRANLKSQIEELPDEKIKRFVLDYQLSEYDATILTDTKETANYFEKAVSVVDTSVKIKSKIIANWIINKKADITKISPEELVKLIRKKTQVVQMDEKELEEVIKKVMAANPKAVADYKAGKQVSLMFLLGQVMKETKGKAEAGKIKNRLMTLLS